MNAQAGTQAAPAPPATVIVVNQNPRSAPPHMLRGTRLYGMTVRSGCMAASLSFGIFLTIIGFIMIQIPIITGAYASILAIIACCCLGGFLIYFHVKARGKALREFNALPADHPDRLKYSGLTFPCTIPGAYPVTNVYQFPTNAQGVNDGSGQPAATASGQTVTSGYHPPSQGQYPPPQGQYPPPQGQYPPPQGQYPPPNGYYPTPEGPSAPLQEPSSKIKDDPPPYSEI
ncbi:splicing factor-like protein 1 [Penaeus monodon]|uniref:splicing factor-like protein 1 n=1 Tax=Penaeus monodon TaxID=6687 RepID=UPI0018A7053E|nr:splicing factor-like protein 1 [Penaeus monodon]